MLLAVEEEDAHKSSEAGPKGNGACGVSILQCERDQCSAHRRGPESRRGL
jgi:hypothetical protein